MQIYLFPIVAIRFHIYFIIFAASTNFFLLVLWKWVCSNSKCNSILYHVISDKQFFKLTKKCYIIAGVYSEPCQTSKMELFAKIVNG